MTVVVMHKNASVKEIGSVLRRIESMGLKPRVTRDNGQTTIGLIGQAPSIDEKALAALPGVVDVRPVEEPFKLGSRHFHGGATEVAVDRVVVGGERFVVMAGPCSVESQDQMLKIARGVADAGASILRGGAFKPRTSPYSFKGLGKEGLEILAKARELTGCPVVTEVLAASDVSLVSDYADMLQIGARNMQNYTLLEAIGETRKPVLLKRGMMSTIEELLLAAEYILAAGNPNVILCERGIRSFEKYTRNTLDISAIPILKQLSHLPVVVDPSHATGRRDLIIPVSRAALAAGADGIIVEVHNDPENALSDGAQSLTLETFEELMAELIPLAPVLGRSFGNR
jgi:3-deoxy-7-phosphoheptulonate synthase